MHIQLPAARNTCTHARTGQARAARGVTCRQPAPLCATSPSGGRSSSATSAVFSCPIAFCSEPRLAFMPLSDCSRKAGGQPRVQHTVMERHGRAITQHGWGSLLASNNPGLAFSAAPGTPAALKQTTTRCRPGPLPAPPAPRPPTHTHSTPLPGAPRCSPRCPRVTTGQQLLRRCRWRACTRPGPAPAAPRRPTCLQRTGYNYVGRNNAARQLLTVCFVGILTRRRYSSCLASMKCAPAPPDSNANKSSSLSRWQACQADSPGARCIRL